MTSPSETPAPAPAPTPGGGSGSVEEHPVKIDVDNPSFFYGAFEALHDISIELREHVVTAFIGPSGCGKRTFLRTLNRMNDLIPGSRVEGRVSLGGRNVYGADVNAVEHGDGSAWSSRSRIHFQSRSSTTWRTAFGSAARSAARKSPTSLRRA